jgi:hypothetical protein
VEATRYCYLSWQIFVLWAYERFFKAVKQSFWVLDHDLPRLQAYNKPYVERGRSEAENDAILEKCH